MFKNTNTIKVDNISDIQSDQLNVILHQTLSYIRQITNADAGTIYLKNDDCLKFYIFQNDSLITSRNDILGEQLKNTKLPIEENSNIIAVESFIRSKVIMVDDIYNNKNFNFKEAKKFDSSFQYKTKSIITAPLINFINNEDIGVIQLINKHDNSGKNIAFTQKDKEYLSLACSFITFTIINTKKNLKEIQKYKDISLELTKSKDELEKMANKDPLTNLYNRRYFNDIIENMIHISNRKNSKITILMIDIDNFKAINDTYGHTVGDGVINKLAQIFNNIIRNSDISIRYGGEEFIIILPYTDIENGKIIAEKLRFTTETSDILLPDNSSLHFTISIGLAEINQKQDEISIALDQADKALYKAKHSGKNTICI